MTVAPASRPSSASSPAAAHADRPLIWLDGQMVPKSQAKVSVYDHGLLYGDGVFEGIRVYNKRIFKCKSHIDRLFRSAKEIRLTIPYSAQEVDALMRQCIEANGLTDAYIRLVVTRGAGTLGLDPRKCPRASLFCIADTIQLYPQEWYTEGMKIIVARRPRVPVECLDPRIKSLNYLNNILAKCEAIDAGVLEAIMLALDGHVTECTGDNIFIIRNGEVSTPPADCGILEGVTRNFVIALCRKHGIKCHERMMRIEDVLAADEVFLTGTAAEMIAVKQIDAKIVGTGKEGPITRKLRDAFKATVAKDAPED